MTNKGAIKELKYSIEPNQGFMECRTGTISEEAIKMAIEALEKQIPKTPIYGAANIKCPNCGATLLYYFHLFKIDYCDECGQRLDWSEGYA